MIASIIWKYFNNKSYYVFHPMKRLILLPTMLCILLLVSCWKQESSTAPAAVPAKPKPLSTDFVVCIDNSGSISPTEQALVRETTMLLADLVDAGDWISVITFGNGARIGASVMIQSDADRLAFRQHVRTALNFTESFSDISAGLKTIARNRDSLFRPSGQSNRAVILLSDGKLEPSDGTAAAAFEQMRVDLQGPLAGIDIYAVVLGDRTSRDQVLVRAGERISGQMLMQNYIASSANRYYHAMNLNQVLDAAVYILNDTKGISSLGEKGATRFRIDDSVESLSLIVRKRSADGNQICRSSDIRLTWPGGEPISVQNIPTALGGAGYWNHEYEFFDLIIVRKPQPGIWEVQALNQGTAEVLSKVMTPIELRLERRDDYFLNEDASLTAWLFNRRDGTASKAPYRLQAHIAQNGDMKGSNIFLPLKSVEGTDQYAMRIPADLRSAVTLGAAGSKVTMELIAERRKAEGNEELDPWFVRRSQPFSINVTPPFADWTLRQSRLTRVPITGTLISYPNPFDHSSDLFGAKVDPTKTNYPDFQTPPRLTLRLIGPNSHTDGNGTLPDEVTIDPVIEKNALIYRLNRPIDNTGVWIYSYRLFGTTERGPFAISSPAFTISVRYGYEFMMLIGLFLLGVLHFISNRLARLLGQVVVAGGQVTTLRRKAERVSVGMAEIQLTAVSLFLFRKRINVQIIKGQLLLGGIVKNTGEKFNLAPKKRHAAVLIQSDERQTQIQIQIHSKVRIM